jgi:hypothetical protein
VAFGAASGNNETLQITNTSGTLGTISNFITFHDIVDLTGVLGGTIGGGGTLSGGDQLVVSNGTDTVTLQLDPGEDYSGITWQTSPDGSGGTDVVACFCRGALILTPDGEVAVEDLAIGDKVVTFSGAARPIKWIGHRAYDGRFIAGKREVLPIRVAAGALADGVPARDLWVSPAHALYIDGVLVPAEHLVNGATIAQAERVERVEYFHIELDTHDVVFAEAAPAESYVDCDNRLMFANGAQYALLHPEDDPPNRRFCAVRLEEGAPELVAIRAGIARRAGLPEETAAPQESGTDHLPNPAMAGAAIGVLGEGGALPTGWHTYSAADLDHAVVGHGDEDGVDYVDLRIFGTPTATTHSNQIFFAGWSVIAANLGERWMAGADVTLCAGSLKNVRAVEIGANLNDSEGQYSSWFRATAFTPLQEAVGRRRTARSGTIADRNAVYFQPLLQLATTAGQAIDLTLRIGQPCAALLGPGGFQEWARAAT